jgi:hypothetical protein
MIIGFAEFAVRDVLERIKLLVLRGYSRPGWLLVAGCQASAVWRDPMKLARTGPVRSASGRVFILIGVCRLDGVRVGEAASRLRGDP